MPALYSCGLFDVPSEDQVADASVDDRQLVEWTAAGRRDAFEELVRRHHAAVIRLVRGALPHSLDAEDAAQDAFLAAYRASGSFRGDASVRTWILTIARHVAYHHRLKSARRSEEALDPLELAQLAGWGAPSPESAAMRAESRDALLQALHTLSAEEREVLILRDLEDLSGEQTAAALELSVSAMKSRLHRARLRLAAAVRQGGTHAAR